MIASEYFAGGMLVGMLVACFALTTVSSLMPDSNYNIVKNAKEICERSLPRDKTCIITAVPKGDKQ